MILLKVIIEDDNIILFLNKYITLGVDYSDSKVLENHLKKIFIKLNDYYDIKIKGYYDVAIYIDKNYGVVIELIKDEYDNYFDSVDMRIMTHNVNLLYKIDDINKYKDYKIYLYKDDFYLELNGNINDIEMGILLEHSKIIYKDLDIIKRNGHILKNML